MTKHRKIDPFFKEAWLDALRSGDYVQGRFRLMKRYGGREMPHFCCLGVACDITGERTTDVFDLPIGLPRAGALKRWNMSRRTATALAEMNDVKQHTFGQIADWIEVNL